MTHSNQTAQALRLLVQEIEKSVIERRPTCVNCLYFESIDELCQLCKARPPAHVIAYACPQWAAKSSDPLDDIPF